VYARVGSSFLSAPIVASGDGPFECTAEPALPEGLSFDAATGGVTGVPVAAGPPSAHVVTVRNVRGVATAGLTVDVDPALPEGAEWLAGGFAAEAVVRDAAFPAKLAVATDGRVFYNELLTGNVRVVSAAGELDPAPVVTVPVLTGGERGLLGIALAPDFASSGAFYVYASTAAEPGGRPDRNRVLRYVLSGVSATGPEVVVDDLPIGGTQNAGALAFGPDGMLYVTVGDTGDAALAQDDASLAGRVLRYAPDGSIPEGNPDASSPEWARGFRNPYGIAFHPESGFLFATENGPTAHDELDLVQPGRNFEWGADPETSFGAFRGIRITDWTPVIVPTGIAIHPGPGFGDAYAGDLFVGSYDRSEVLRIRLSGIDLESEEPFLRLTETGGAEKPLDVAVAPDGALWVSTFSTVWKLRRD
jgi:glucose/arabinose dehydrogenase